MKLTLLENDDPPMRKATEGKPAVHSSKSVGRKAKAGKTKFHGAFSDSKDAEAKHKTIPGSFIKPVKVRGQQRYVVIEKVS